MLGEMTLSVPMHGGLFVHALVPTAVAHDLQEKIPSAKVKPLIPHKEAYISSNEVCLAIQIQLFIEAIYDILFR